MKKSRRILVIGVSAIVALAVLGAVIGSRNATSGVVGSGEPPMGDDVTTSIDQALGRATNVSPFIAPNSAPAFDSLEASRQSAGDSSAPSGGSGSAPVSPSVSDSDRKIVQTAAMRLQVKEVGGSFEEVGRIATSAGGFVASSNFSYQGDQQIASMTIRVPATRYQEVLSDVRKLGAKVDSETSNASDITEEYSDLAARLRNLEATEAQLLQLLSQARNVNEVLQVQDRLNSVRSEIERVKGRMALLDKLSELATLTVHLRPVAGATKVDNGGVDLGQAISEAWNDSIQFLGSITEGVLTVVVFSWWIPFLAVPAALAFQRWQRNRPHPATPAAYD